MKLWDKIQGRLKQSPRTRSILLYLFFVVISAMFWSFLTFNRDVQLDMEVPVEVSLPSNVHLLAKVPDTLTVTVRDRGYRFFSYLFHKTPKLTLRFTDYSDGKETWTADLAMVKGDDGLWKTEEAWPMEAGVEFKVRQGLSWDNAFPADNFKVEEAGTDDVQFDEATGEVSLIPAE